MCVKCRGDAFASMGLRKRGGGGGRSIRSSQKPGKGIENSRGAQANASN